MPFRAHEKLPKWSKTTVVVLNWCVVSGSCITGAKWHCPLNPKASLKYLLHTVNGEEQKR